MCRLLLNKQEKVLNKIKSTKEQNNQFINQIERLNEDIQISKFDLTLILNKEKTLPKLNLRPKETSECSPNLGETSKTLTFQITNDRPLGRRHNPSETNITELTPTRKKHHRVIKSMKLEINKKIFEDKLVFMRPKVEKPKNQEPVHINERTGSAQFGLKKNSEDNVFICNKRSMKKRKSLSPDRSKGNMHFIHKLKEQNIIYSNLFEMRMKKERRHTLKVPGKDYDSENSVLATFRPTNENENLQCNLITKPEMSRNDLQSIEKENSNKNSQMDELQEKVNSNINNQISFMTIMDKPANNNKAKHLAFNFQICIMLLFTVWVSVVLHEVRMSFKLLFFPMRMILNVNGFFVNKFSSFLRKNKKC